MSIHRLGGKLTSMIGSRVSLTTQVLIALAAGLAVGALIAASGSSSLTAMPGYLEPIGTLWVNALRMVVVIVLMSGWALMSSLRIMSASRITCT